MNGLIPLSAVALTAAMLIPLSAQAAVNDPTSIPTGVAAAGAMLAIAGLGVTLGLASRRRRHVGAHARV